jgi:hypothetical protein
VSKSPGLGDPYWFEWSIGLRQAIKMLQPGSEIVSVTLQASGSTGLDDVVVRHRARPSLLVQVKHTRADDTLTFGDLVDGATGISLLRSVATHWQQEHRNSGHECVAQISTNRRLGTHQVTLSPSGLVRPALAQFLAHLEREASVAEGLRAIEWPPEWEQAWREEWLRELSTLTDDEALCFSRSFRVQVEPSLDELQSELTSMLAALFCPSRPAEAEHLRATLDSRLRTWATSHRGEVEEIRAADVWAALSLADDLVGEHDLAPPAPFFASRETVVDELRKTLASAGPPIVFLSGEPGCGKTSVVTSITNGRCPLVDARYYAYRPITPENQLLPTDSGKTTLARSLWGDLLVQLRNLAKSDLFKLRVAIRNQFLTTNELRAECLRLAAHLGSQRDAPFVVAIDGIDHAARSGADLESFLESLPAPDQVPPNVKFLLSGQPPEGYRRYPSWLRADHPLVRRIDLGRLPAADIETLLRTRLPDAEAILLEAAAQTIWQTTEGHTLAAVFAVEEAQDTSHDLANLSDRLQARRLDSGIEAYYRATWNSVEAQLRLSDVALRLAACLTLSPNRITGTLAAAVAGDAPEAAANWSAHLRALRPLLVEEPTGFRVFHNDVRVFLARLLEGEDSIYKECASRLADTLIAGEDAVARHAAALHLLGICHRFTDQLNLYSPEYILEGHAIGQSLADLATQGLGVVANLRVIEPDWDLAHQIACGLRTVAQLRASLEWANRKEQTLSGNIVPLLVAERVVPPAQKWTESLLRSVLSDLEALWEAGQFDRARGTFMRWFSGLTPAEIVSRAAKEARFKQERAELTKGLASRIGKLSLRVRILLDEPRKRAGLAEAGYSTGILEALAREPSPGWFRRGLRRLRSYYWDDLCSFLSNLIDSRSWKHAATLIRFVREATDAPWSFRITAAATACLIADNRSRALWVPPVLADVGGAVSSVSRNATRGDTLESVTLCWLAFVLGHQQEGRDPSAIRESIERARPTDRDEEKLAELLHAAALLGAQVRALQEGNDQCPHASPDLVRRVVGLLMTAQARTAGRLVHGYVQAASRIVAGYAEATLLAPRLRESVVAVFKEQCHRSVLGMFLPTVWRTLKAHGHSATLLQYANRRIGPNGEAWNQGPAELHEEVEDLMPLLADLGATELAEATKQRKAWSSVGYTDHNEYSVYQPMQWLRAAGRLRPQVWESYGLRLIAVSVEASRTGDNRASWEVTTALVELAASVGPHALESLLASAGESISSMDFAFGEGLSSHARRTPLCKEDLCAFWALTIGQFSWRNYSDRKHLGEMRTALKESARGWGCAEELESLLNATPAENACIPEEEAKRQDPEAETDACMPIRSALERLPFTQENWSRIAAILARLEKERPPDTANILEEVLAQLNAVPSEGPWSFSGRRKTYESLFSLMNERQKWSAIVAAVNDDPTIAQEYRVQALGENIDELCLLHGVGASFEALERGTERTLAMHETWISGAERVKPLRNVPLRVGAAVSSWSAFASRRLLETLEFDEQSQVQCALTGLCLLSTHSPGTTQLAIAALPMCPEETRSRFMLITEKLATCIPRDDVIHLEHWLDSMLDDPNLEVAVSASLALSALGRAESRETRTWRTGPFASPPLVRPVSVPLLVRPEVRKGGLATAPRPASSHLQHLSIVTGRTSDDIESELSTELDANALVKRRPRSHPRSSRGGMVIPPDPECDALMRILSRHERYGRFSKIPFLRLAQVIAPAADPFVFTRSPKLLDGLCPVDHALDELLKNPVLARSELDLRLRSALPSGTTLLGGQLDTYSNRFDVQIRLHHTRRSSPRRVPSVLNGRAALYYGDFDVLSFDGQVDRDWLSVRVGGMFRFIHGLAEVFPTAVWTDELDWQPSELNPLEWWRGGVKVGWFERLHGEIRLTSGFNRQPILSRWVCTITEWERIVALWGAPPEAVVELETHAFQED